MVRAKITSCAYPSCTLRLAIRVEDVIPFCRTHFHILRHHGPHCYTDNILVCGWPAYHARSYCQTCAVLVIDDDHTEHHLITMDWKAIYTVFQ